MFLHAYVCHFVRAGFTYFCVCVFSVCVFIYTWICTCVYIFGVMYVHMDVCMRRHKQMRHVTTHLAHHTFEHTHMHTYTRNTSARRPHLTTHSIRTPTNKSLHAVSALDQAVYASRRRSSPALLSLCPCAFHVLPTKQCFAPLACTWFHVHGAYIHTHTHIYGYCFLPVYIAYWFSLLPPPYIAYWFSLLPPPYIAYWFSLVPPLPADALQLVGTRDL